MNSRPTLIALIAISGAVLFSCAPHTTRTAMIKYEVPMVKVDRPADVKIRYGASEEVLLKPENKYLFSDSLIDGLFFVSTENFNFTITNKSDKTMKLIWDDAVMIEADNTSTRVMHLGVKYNERDQSIPPSIIPRNGRLEDQATPTNRVKWREGSYSEYWSAPGGWDTEGIFPSVKTVTLDNAKSIPVKEFESFFLEAKGKVGSKIGLLLPLEIEGVKNEYTFWFQVNAAEVDTSAAPLTTYY